MKNLSQKAEVRVIGNADSRAAKRHLFDLLFAIGDCVAIRETNASEKTKQKK